MGLDSGEHKDKLAIYIKDPQPGDTSFMVTETRGRVSDLTLQREFSTASSNIKLLREISGIDWPDEAGTSEEKKIQLINKLSVVAKDTSLPLFLMTTVVPITLGDGACQTDNLRADAKGYIEFEKHSDGKVAVTNHLFYSRIGYFKKVNVSITSEEYLKSADSAQSMDVSQLPKEKTLTQIEWDPLRIPFVGMERTLDIRKLENFVTRNATNGIEMSHLNFSVDWTAPSKPPIQLGYLAASEDHKSVVFSSVAGDVTRTGGFTQEACCNTMWLLISSHRPLRIKGLIQMIWTPPDLSLNYTAPNAWNLIIFQNTSTSPPKARQQAEKSTAIPSKR